MKTSSSGAPWIREATCSLADIESSGGAFPTNTSLEGFAIHSRNHGIIASKTAGSTCVVALLSKINDFAGD